MRFVQRHPQLSVLVLALVAAFVFIGGYGVYLAGEAGELPWQTDPTRIAITPFAGIPGFGGATATGSPAP